MAVRRVERRRGARQPDGAERGAGVGADRQDSPTENQTQPIAGNLFVFSAHHSYVLSTHYHYTSSSLPIHNFLEN